jgi:restriction system protein
MGNAFNAVIQVLKDAGEPLHYKEIARRVLDSQLWTSGGKTPEATVSAQLTIHIKKHGKNAKIHRVGPGTFSLNGALPVSDTNGSVSSPTAGNANSVGQLSFTDAAEQVLTQLGGGQPMHSREITAKALELGLIRTSGRTPEATMYASVMEEIQRYKKRGEQPRFHMPGKSMIGLAKSLPVGIPSQVDQHNRKVRTQLHARLMAMQWGEFEDLIGKVLAELGFVEVAVTPRRSDKGIDVRGTMVIGDAVRIRMAVQVKRWKHNVQAPTVQQVRGSLGAHEQGLIITTSDFSPGARKEAVRANAAPVGLMNGHQLINLLLEHEIGVSRVTLDLFELASQAYGPPDKAANA